MNRNEIFARPRDLALAVTLISVVCIGTSAAPPAGLLGEWKFDQGDVAQDTSGHGRHAAVHGASWVRQGDGFASLWTVKTTTCSSMPSQSSQSPGQSALRRGSSRHAKPRA